MTTVLYRPVLIETAEQAEKLPQGAIVFDGDPEDGDTYARFKDDWHASGYPYSLSEALRVGLAVTALVPVEAEEEWAETNEHGGVDPVPNEKFAREYSADWGNPPSRRLVTPWAEVTSP